jgi:uncharacterized integral membrane protein
MIFKKKILLLTFFLIIIIQSFFYTNNSHKTSFRYFNWTIQEISVGKLIGISFFSGLFISTLLNNTIGINKRNAKNKNNNFENIEENHEPLDNEESFNSNIEMPPQRDIRDTQPTISVNYRVVKTNQENDFKRDKNYSNNTDNRDDWDNVDNEW